MLSGVSVPAKAALKSAAFFLLRLGQVKKQYAIFCFREHFLPIFCKAR